MLPWTTVDRRGWAHHWAAFPPGWHGSGSGLAEGCLPPFETRQLLPFLPLTFETAPWHRVFFFCFCFFLSGLILFVCLALTCNKHPIYHFVIMKAAWAWCNYDFHINITYARRTQLQNPNKTLNLRDKILEKCAVTHSDTGSGNATLPNTVDCSMIQVLAFGPGLWALNDQRSKSPKKPEHHLSLVIPPTAHYQRFVKIKKCNWISFLTLSFLLTARPINTGWHITSVVGERYPFLAEKAQQPLLYCIYWGSSHEDLKVTSLQHWAPTSQYADAPGADGNGCSHFCSQPRIGTWTLGTCW